MGVTGLWRLIEPVGKPVPVETLENKVLAVDISIWLHQMVKGYQDAKGAPLPNAHLMGLFQRLCKLLYFRIKPVFVFDGGFPDLKRETIAKRQDHKAKYYSESERLKRELALVLSKKTAVSSLLGKQVSPKTSTVNDVNNDDIFKLPALPQRDDETESESEEEHSSSSVGDLHSIDMESENFKALPVKEKYELLIELKETRKMNSWGKLHELPKKSDNFSDFQMQRLLKRRKVQECLQETEKEMGDTGMSLNDLESLLNEEGIDTEIESLPTRRIASNNNTRFLLINNVKEALAEAKRKQEAESTSETSTLEVKPSGSEDKVMKKSELEEDLEKAIRMSLQCVNETDISTCNSKTDDSWTSALTDTDSSDSEDDFEPPDNMSSAKAYIMQYTDLTNKAIDNIVAKNKNDKSESNKIPNADQIIEELKKETYVVDNIDLASSDDECKQDYQKNSDQTCEECVIELNTTHENFQTNMDATQASVMCIENSEQAILCLDTSSEDDAKNYEQLNCDANFKYNEKSRNEIVNLDEDLERAISMSLECVKEPEQVVFDSIEFDSSSSDIDFEEVTEKEESRKPVIQLTLNVGDAPEDDIFADIFQANIEPAPACVKEKVTDTVIKTEKHVRINKTDTSLNSETNPEVNNSIEQVMSSFKLNIEKKGALSEPTIKMNVGDGTKSDANKPKTASQDATKSTDVPKAAPEIVEKKSIEEKVSNKDITEKTVTDKLIDKPSREPISLEQLNTIEEELQSAERDLINEKGRVDRIGRNITEQMTKEAQELLQIFGIPYIVAPMEAEAQCAFLESVKLTDGTITDDSDVWLFGGRTVYKNFFNQKKHVLQFLAERIEKSFKLSREQLILLALLVGSDYTTGVTGVGPVTALEILASFPFNKNIFLSETSKQARYEHVIAGLQEFKKWVQAGKRTDNITLKRKLKNVHLTEDFPSSRVVQAYLEPNIEKNEDKFTWGELDITVLRDYTKAKFGWSQNKLDEIIKPVLKRMIDRKSQRSVHDYFKRKVEFQNLEDQMSKRVKAAVEKMGPERPTQENACVDNMTENESKPTRKRKVTKKAGKGKDLEIPGPSISKVIKSAEDKVFHDHSVKVVSQFMQDGKSDIEIIIKKTDRVQEIIPQREREKQNLLQNKLKAIEVFRKTNIDRQKKTTKRKINLPKEKAELSESSDSD